MLVLGCDFSSSPNKRKPIVVCEAELLPARTNHGLNSLNTDKNTYSVLNVRQLHSFINFTQLLDYLKNLPAWVAGFDFPFGLPSQLVQDLAWPNTWLASMQHYTAFSRADIRAQFKAYCDARPVGQKFAHRATDLIAKSSPSMKWVNPPVAYMMHAGVPLLLELNAQIVGLHQTSHAPPFFALEAYPGMLARHWVGNKSYKSDDIQKQDQARYLMRQKIVQGLVNGYQALGIQLQASHQHLSVLQNDASADSLDACLCAISAAWALKQYQSGDLLWGLSKNMNRLEGEIISAMQCRLD